MKSVVANSQKAVQSVRDEFNRILLLDQELIVHIYAICLYISSLLLTGYRVYFSNQTIQIPLVHLLNDPTLYANDPFASTLLSYSSPLWRVVAWASHLIPLEPLLFLLFLFERFIVIYAAGALANAFVPGSRLAILGTMALFSLAPDSILGGGTLVESYFEQTGLSIPFILLAIAAFYRGHFFITAVWLAVVFNLNSMYGVYAFTYLSALFLWDANYRNQWKQYILPGIAFLLLASPGIVSTLSAFGKGAVDSELWLTLSEMRFPHHLYPLTWEPVAFLEFGVLAVLLIIILSTHKTAFPKLFSASVAWTGASVLWLGYAFVAAYIARSPSMLVMHPARATDLWYCLAATALISVTTFNLEKNKTQRNLFVTVLVMGIVFRLLTALIGTKWKLAAFLLILAATLWKPTWNLLFRQASRKWLSAALPILVFLSGIGAYYGRYKTDKNLQSAFYIRPNSDVETIARWAKASTPSDAMFLVNPSYAEWSQFRGLAQRPIYGSWRDGSAILWDRPFVKPWFERLQTLGFETQWAQEMRGTSENSNAREKIRSALEQRYTRLSDQDVQTFKLARINYWVVPIEHVSQFPSVFQTENFKVLQVK